MNHTNGAEAKRPYTAFADDAEVSAVRAQDNNQAEPGAHGDSSATDFAEDAESFAARDAHEIDIDALEYDRPVMSESSEPNNLQRLIAMVETSDGDFVEICMGGKRYGVPFPCRYLGGDDTSLPDEGPRAITADGNTSVEAAGGQKGNGNSPSSPGKLRSGRLRTYIEEDYPRADTDNSQDTPKKRIILYFNAFSDEAMITIDIDRYDCDQLNVDVLRADGTIECSKHVVGDESFDIFVDVNYLDDVKDIKSISAYLAKGDDVLEALVMSYVFEDAKHVEHRRPWEL